MPQGQPYSGRRIRLKTVLDHGSVGGGHKIELDEMIGVHEGSCSCVVRGRCFRATCQPNTEGEASESVGEGIGKIAGSSGLVPHRRHSKDALIEACPDPASDGSCIAFVIRDFVFWETLEHCIEITIFAVVDFLEDFMRCFDEVQRE